MFALAHSHEFYRQQCGSVLETATLLPALNADPLVGHIQTRGCVRACDHLDRPHKLSFRKGPLYLIRAHIKM